MDNVYQGTFLNTPLHWPKHMKELLHTILDILS